MIRWWETSSPEAYSSNIAVFVLLGAVALTALLCWFAYYGATWKQASPWLISSIVASIFLIVSSIGLANSHNLYHVSNRAVGWSETYGDIYNTCRSEDKPIPDCRKVAVDTANHYHPKKKRESR